MKQNSVKVSNLDVLQEHIRQLLDSSGEKMRVVLKYRHSDAKLSLKVTDDKKTAKFKTTHGSDLEKVKRVIGYVVTGEYKAGIEPSSPLRTAAKKGKNKRAKKG